MTGGGSFLPVRGEEYELGGGGGGHAGHAVQWVGTPSVKGPRWARMPLLTVGMLGIQCVWSIEMGYASPYLLELGLSKSFMSLVFMAGPLSGLIVQPLIGIFADRSKSRWGRRRPFMIAGISVCAFAMMLLGWAKELGGGGTMSIIMAIFAIYLIDFSINAAMSTDRALVVDTLPPEKQEEGSAWAGRMFGFGSVAGFFVGNLNLTPIFPFLGNTQIQILSFITSFIVLITHGLTSWAVTERVLLRDDRPQARSGLLLNLRAIWDNMLTLPRGIRTVCYIQFFAFLGWFPILFFTSIWVAEIYKSSYSGPTIDPAELEADGVRAGARALLFQALINIACSVGLPFLVAESGVQASSSSAGGSGSRGAGWSMREIKSRIRNGTLFNLPIQGFTLIKLWYISQFVFAAAMGMTWFVSTVHGAYIVIGITGFCWALCQWAPYSLIGELILLDGSLNRDPNYNAMTDLHHRRSRNSVDSETYQDESGLDLTSPTPKSRKAVPAAPSPPAYSEGEGTSRTNTPYQSAMASASRSTISLSPSAGAEDESFQSQDRQGGGDDLTPYVSQKPQMPAASASTVILRHSGDESSDDEGDIQNLSFGLDPASASASPRRHQQVEGNGGGGGDTADKAGVILGIFNVFVVMPQFVVTAMSSVIFHIMEPPTGTTDLPPKHPNALPIPAGNGTLADVVAREGAVVEAGSPDAVGLIFRIGGVAACVGGIICVRLANDWKRGRGL